MVEAVCEGNLEAVRELVIRNPCFVPRRNGSPEGHQEYFTENVSKTFPFDDESLGDYNGANFDLVELCAVIGQTDLLRILLKDFDACVTKSDKYEINPIKLAQFHNQPGIVRLLADHVPREQFISVIEGAVNMGQVDILEAVWEANKIDLLETLTTDISLASLLFDNVHEESSLPKNVARVVTWLLERDLLPYGSLPNLLTNCLNKGFRDVAYTLMDNAGSTNLTNLPFCDPTNTNLQDILIQRYMVDWTSLSHGDCQQLLFHYLKIYHGSLRGNSTHIQASLRLVRQLLEIDPTIIFTTDYTYPRYVHALQMVTMYQHWDVLILFMEYLERLQDASEVAGAFLRTLFNSATIQMIHACFHLQTDRILNCFEHLSKTPGSKITGAPSRQPLVGERWDNHDALLVKFWKPQDVASKNHLRTEALRVLLEYNHIDVFHVVYAHFIDTCPIESRQETARKVLEPLLQQVVGLGLTHAAEVVCALLSEWTTIDIIVLDHLWFHCAHPDTLRFLFSLGQPPLAAVTDHITFCCEYKPHTVKDPMLRKRRVESFRIVLAYLVEHFGGVAALHSEIDLLCRVEMCQLGIVEMQRILHEYGCLLVKYDEYDDDFDIVISNRGIFWALCQTGCIEGVQMCMDEVYQEGGWTMVLKFLRLREKGVVTAWMVAQENGHPEMATWLREEEVRVAKLVVQILTL